MTFPSAAAAALDKHPTHAVNTPNGTKLNLHRVRFDFPFSDRDPVPQAPKILHSLFRRLVDSVNDIEFRDVLGRVVDLDSFPQDKSTFDTMFNTTVSDQRQRHILVVVEIRSFKTFYELKQFIWQWLSKYNVFMKQHTLGFDQVDICSPGWFSHTNPTYHSKERTKDDIFYWATETLNNLSHDEQLEMAEHFPSYHHEDGSFEIPEFQLVHRTIAGKSSSGKVETEAYEVQIERQHGKVFKRVMELTFESATSNDMLFIPFALKRELSGDEYSSIIQQQSIYLDNHRNISIVGIGNRRMLTAVTYDNDETSFEDLLKSKEGVYRVDSTKRTPDLGKWNISTDKKHYSNLATWIDSILADFFALVESDDTEPMDEFPEPKRLSRTPTNRNKSNATSTYAKKIQAAFSTANSTASTTASAPSIPRRSVWNRPPVDIEYKNNSNDEFPPLPSTKPSTSEDTRSTASSTRLTFNEDSIHKAIANSKSAWESDTKKFQAEMRQSQQDLKQSIGDLINNALATQVKKIVDETVTAFGTNANLSKHFIARSELDDIVSRISTEMAKQLQALNRDTPRKPPAKRQQLTPTSPSRNYYSSLGTQDMNDDYEEVNSARSNLFENDYDTPPRRKPPSV
jgi:hypothetical protein